MRRLALLLATALLAGCGSGDTERHNAYVDSVNAARVEFDRRVAEITARLAETSTPARTRAALGDLVAAARDFELRLRAATPPERVAGLHREFVAAAGRYGADLSRARERFRNEDPNVYLEARTELQRDAAAAARRLNALIDRINRRLRA